MGEYTGLRASFILDLEKISPKERMALHFMLCKIRVLVMDIPDHDLFKCERWRHMFLGNSAYLEENFSPSYSLIDNKLNVCFNIKNYDNEIEKFLNWISPFIDRKQDNSMWGIYEYNGWDRPIYLIWNNDIIISDFTSLKMDEYYG